MVSRINVLYVVLFVRAHFVNFVKGSFGICDWIMCQIRLLSFSFFICPGETNTGHPSERTSGPLRLAVKLSPRDSRCELCHWVAMLALGDSGGSHPPSVHVLAPPTDACSEVEEL